MPRGCTILPPATRTSPGSCRRRSAIRSSSRSAAGVRDRLRDDGPPRPGGRVVHALLAARSPTRSSTSRSRRPSASRAVRSSTSDASAAWGNELAVNVRVLEGRRFAWEIGTQLASNGNRIDDMGGTQFLTVGGGGQAQNRVGYRHRRLLPVQGPYAGTRRDRRAVDLPSICDGGTGKSAAWSKAARTCPASTAPRVFWGHSQPTWQAGVQHRHAVRQAASVRSRRRKRRPSAVQHRDPRAPQPGLDVGRDQEGRSVPPGLSINRGGRGWAPTRRASCACASSRPTTRSTSVSRNGFAPPAPP